MNNYLRLFIEFFKIGLFSFGGGISMIPLVKDAVLKFNWLTENQFYDFIGICESTPGPIAVNIATYIGTRQGGILGAFLATLAVVLPSFIIILLIATILKNFINNKYVVRALQGLKAAVLGLISATALTMTMERIGYSNIHSEFHFDYISLIILIVLSSIYLIVTKVFKKKIGTITIILIGASLGILFCVIL